MVGQAYLIPLEAYQFDLRSEKVNSIARLIKLQIPTVPLPHVLLPSSFEFYRQNKRLAPKAEKELASFFTKLQRAGYPATVRPSIFADIPGAEFIVANNVNLPTFEEMKAAIAAGYDQVLKEFGQAVKIEFAHLLQGFYTANKAGVVYSEDGAGGVYISAVFGEHTWLITRGEVEPDIYRVDKKTPEIKDKKIATKKFSLEPSASGLKRVRLAAVARTLAVFTDQEINQIFEYALRMEKAHGPQEIEAAVLRTGQVIFQSSRDSQVKKQPISTAENLPIFLQPVKGKLVFINRPENLSRDWRDWIVATDNLDIDFITHLVYRAQPKAVVLTKGSLTAHAVTILREAKIPSILAPGFQIGREKFCRIKANGQINCYS